MHVWGSIVLLHHSARFHEQVDEKFLISTHGDVDEANRDQMSLKVLIYITHVKAELIAISEPVVEIQSLYCLIND